MKGVVGGGRVGEKLLVCVGEMRANIEKYKLFSAVIFEYKIRYSRSVAIHHESNNTHTDTHTYAYIYTHTHVRTYVPCLVLVEALRWSPTP